MNKKFFIGIFVLLFLIIILLSILLLQAYAAIAEIDGLMNSLLKMIDNLGIELNSLLFGQ